MLKRHLILLDPAPGDGNGNPPPASGISVEDHHKGIEKARLEERQKLHGEKTAAETRAANAEAETARLKAEADALKASTRVTAEGTQVDVPKLVSEITGAAEKRFRDAADAESASLKTEIGTLRQSLTALQLNTLRGQLVAQAGGEDKLVTALIDVSSEDALRASVVRAKQAYDDIESRVKAATGAPPQTATPAPLTPPPLLSPTGGGGAGVGAPGTLLPTVKAMSKGDYKENRSKVLQDLKNRFPTVRV